MNRGYEDNLYYEDDFYYDEDSIDYIDKIRLCLVHFGYIDSCVSGIDSLEINEDYIYRFSKQNKNSNCQ